MTKTLTEQWREGTLPENWYYIHLKSDWGGIDCITINYCDEDGVFEEYPDEDIKEVLAPVPSYSEYQSLKDNCELTHTRLKGAHQKIDKLEKQLEISTKALKEIQEYTKEYSLPSYTGMLCHKAIKEMEGVK